MEITNRERQILHLITEEFTSKEIANKLFVSVETINSHRKNMKCKLNAKNTAGLISKAYRSGIMIGVGCLIFTLLIPSVILGQTRNLHIEGSDDQYGVIQTTSSGSSKSGIELLRGNEFNSTDWRIQNNSGNFQLEDGINNFLTSGTVNFQITPLGVVNIFNGTDAMPDNNLSGTLILGTPTGLHIALDNNGIIARNNESGSQLLLQTGPDQGDTYLNNLSGDVGIGTSTPEAKLGVEDNGFQMKLSNADQLTNKWFIGASHDSWNVGGNKLVFSTSSSSADAMLVLNKDENTVSVRNHNITNVADPTNDKDAVNLRTLKSYTKIINLSTLESNLDFEDCTTRCRFLSEAGYDDWKMPSLDDAAQFVRFTEGSGDIWTTQYGGLGEPGTVLASANYYILIDLQDGEMSRALPSSDHLCRCVR